jgi:ankyrin repeat protein
MLRKALATLPPTLDQTYDRILCAISDEDSNYALRILRWLTFSERPLCVEEIAEVVAIDITRDPAFDRDEVLEDPLEVLSICSSLVALTTISQSDGHDRPLRSKRIISLAHYSVQEYLVSDRIKQGEARRYCMQEATCHNAITQSCLQYLLQFQQESLPKDVPNTFALVKYSARFWSSHIQKTRKDFGGIRRLIMDLLLTKNPAYFNWCRFCCPENDWCDLEMDSEQMPHPLYSVAVLGLDTVAQTLLEAGTDANAHGGYYKNALQVAAAKGHEQVVMKLLKAGAEVDAFTEYHGSSLIIASYKGHAQIVKILLEAGADVNLKCISSNDALQAASSHEKSSAEQDQIIEMLLEAGAEVNTSGGRWGSALQAASFWGHAKVAKILLKAGADVNAVGGPYENALMAASYRGYGDLVELLLEAGAEVNVPSITRTNALQLASYRGHEKVVMTLLKAGADVAVRNGLGVTALYSASDQCHRQVVETLLDAGAEVNAQTSYGHGNALQTAVFWRCEPIVRVLLKAGADVNAQGGRYGNALLAASCNKEGANMVKILLEAGADVNAQDEQHSNALQVASVHGCEQIVRILLEAGAKYVDS